MAGFGWRDGALTWEQLGLSRRALPGGVRLGLSAVAMAGVGIAAAAASPWGRGRFDDGRYATPGDAIRAALVEIPVTTVIPEELLFRSVLHAVLGRVGGRRTQYVVGSALFGVWHLRGAGSAREVGGIDRAWTVTTVAVTTVAVTTVAGAVFIWLRERSGSVVAPMLAHWAINGSGALAAAATHRVIERQRRGVAFRT